MRWAERFASPPVAAFATTRVVLFIVSYLCLRWFPTHTLLFWQADALPGNNWLNGWLRWDAMWYESIVDAGARLLPPEHSNANFFPLYAWISWLCARPLRLFLEPTTAFYVGALIVSHVSFLAALIGVHRLASALVGPAPAERTVWLVACFPFSFFFSAAYSDALYFCFAAWCFRFARTGRSALAAACATAAAVTRPPGFALVLALIAERVSAHHWRFRSLRREMVAGGILALAPLIVGGYLWIRYGSPAAFVQARQMGWHRASGLTGLMTDFREFTAGGLFECGNVTDCLRGWDLTRTLLGYWYITLIPATVLLTCFAGRRLGAGQVVWVVASVIMGLANGLDGTGRFVAVLFPAFIAAGIAIGSRPALATVCGFFTPFLLLFTCQFARWRPVL